MNSGAYKVVRGILFAVMAVLAILTAAALIAGASDPYSSGEIFVLYPFAIAAAVLIELVLYQCTALVGNAAGGRGVSLNSARHLHRMEQLLGFLGMVAALLIPVCVAADLTDKAVIAAASAAVLAVSIIVVMRIDKTKKAVLAHFHAEDYFDKKEDRDR